MPELVRTEELRVVLMLHVVHRDHRGHRTEARLEVGERTEPQVEALATDQVAQTFGAALPAATPQPAEPHFERPPHPAHHRAEQISKPRGDVTPVLAVQPLESPAEAAEDPNYPPPLRARAAALPREEHPAAPGRVLRQGAVVVVRRDQHKLVSAPPEQLGEEVA